MKMLYLSDNDFNKIGIDWDETIGVIKDAVVCYENNDYSQPIKPYLRYKDKKNRIIAMPGFIGNKFNMAGIKWIASFPHNINNGLPRAHCVVILNEAETGKPICIINSPLISIIRTISVSGLVIKYYLHARSVDDINLGITGIGPIGRNHLKMACSLLGDKLKNIFLYDINDVDLNLIDIPDEYRNKITVKSSWENTYKNADIFITATVSKETYINRKPKEGSLHLNVSLRDYKTSVFDYFKDSIIVDNWKEVCREKTDIEIMHKEKGLKKEQTKTIIDVINYFISSLEDKTPIMFNPMGMAIFDIAISSYYYFKAKQEGVGTKIS
jgi:N-[(2S)-2-amino-2-carboxyethyl]-L-glutamate dehydrogenase